MFLLPISLLGGAAAILSFSSLSNMAQTYFAVKQHHNNISVSTRKSSAANTAQSIYVADRMKKWKSVDEGLDELRRMSRRELVELYLELESVNCTLKMFRNAKRDTRFDGYLLDNGPILVS